MKSLARVAIVVAVLSVPIFAFAQGSGSFQQTIPGVGSFGSQFFTGGSFISPFGGGMFGGGGIGGFGIMAVANNILWIINTVLVPVLFAVAFIVFLYGVAKTYIFSRGSEEEVKAGHHIILWGVIGFTVMISVWGLVNVVATTFGLTSTFLPPLPYSYFYFGGGPVGGFAPPLPGGQTGGAAPQTQSAPSSPSGSSVAPQVPRTESI